MNSRYDYLPYFYSRVFEYEGSPRKVWWQFFGDNGENLLHLHFFLSHSWSFHNLFFFHKFCLILTCNFNVQLERQLKLEILILKLPLSG